MITIIRELFINMAIMTSLTMFANMLMHEKYLKLSRKNNIRNGILTGLLGCVLMLFSVQLSPQVIMDFRAIPVILAGLYVSPLAAMEAAMIIGAFRIAYFGINQPSLIALLVIVLVGAGCGLVGKMKLPIKVKWLFAASLVSIITGLSLFYVTMDLSNQVTILFVYIIGMASISVLMCFFIEFVTSFNQKMDRIKEEAEKDFLTGLKTPRQFDRSLNKQLDVAVAEHKSVALLYMDIDYFKMVNDQHGHAGGDQVLKDLGKILKRMSRSQDVVSRKGGEEFTMLLIDCSLEQAVLVAERIRKAIEAHDFRVDNQKTVKITISIGVSAIPETTLEDDKLLDQADIALYRAKQSGRNKVVVAS